MPRKAETENEFVAWHIYSFADSRDSYRSRDDKEKQAMKRPERCKWTAWSYTGKPICLLEEDFCENVEICEQEKGEAQTVDCAWIDDRQPQIR